ncbi:hypothetical protein EGW08_000722 [Elysia chlorotica]|uniref:Integrase catalytic domain-containing protein n=1 Tax=Elysia chlorotica TaxID=188477 RepID=A0A433UCB9_ELYCH|nr:hypothetical protein EGW08_000722 [Elysia chlorotica]
MEQIAEFRRGGQIPLDDGTFLPVTSVALPEEEVTNMPVTKGYVDNHPVKGLRDTGCSSAIVREDLVPEENRLEEYTTLILADGTVRNTQRAMVYVDTPYFSGQRRALCMKTPVYDLIIGNIEGARSADDPDPYWKPEACAVMTRGQAKTEGHTTPLKVAEKVNMSIIDRDKLVELQSADETLQRCRVMNEPFEIKGKKVEFLTKSGVLYRQCTTPGEKPSLQVVVPECLRGKIMNLAYDSIFGAHLGITKTLSRIQAILYWPNMGGDVTRFCKSCDICQRTISKSRVQKVPLQNMPLIDVPFKRVAVDLIGPISPPSESGHPYILTLVDYATRYPEATALKKIDTPTVAEALVDMFSRLGIPEEILSDLGTQFVSECMEEVNRLLSIRHLTTTPYHPMCNGLVERFNGTLKTMLKKLCAEQPRQWHRFINALLFAYREVPQESTGFSPFELLYGRTVRGPMHILKELWTEDVDTPEVKTSYQYIFELREKLDATLKLARAELEKAQSKGKRHYDSKAKPRKFQQGDRVLLLLPTDHNKLLMQWKGPYEVEQVVGINDYKVKIGRGSKVFHANLLKKYITRDNESSSQDVMTSCLAVEEDDGDKEIFELMKLDIRSLESINLGENLGEEHQKELNSLVKEFGDLFTPNPGMTDIIQHQIKLTSDVPVYSKPYRLPYATRQDLICLILWLYIEARDEPDSRRYEECPFLLGRYFSSYKDLGGPHPDIAWSLQKSANFTIKPSKCILGTDNVDFIGHRLSGGTKGLHEDNVRKINKASRPITKKQVRSFMGLANYYRDSALLKKRQPNTVRWEEPQERAFQTMRTLLTQRPILRLPDPSKTFIIRTDASNDGIGAVLMPYPVNTEARS